MLYPLLFHPILKHRVWGGRALERLGKPLPPDEPIGESWEIADLPDEVEGGRSIVANGPLAGRSLSELIAAEPERVLGRAGGGRFPLLIKYLDARENLSVQVHPDRAYAEAHPNAHLKDEAWVVVDHDPGAVIYKGLKADVDGRRLRERIADGTIVDDLVAIEVGRGECHYLPSGTVHALGAGVLVAEVQTPSDTTFRIYDWDRTSRALHVEEALEVISNQASRNALRAEARCRSGEPMIVGHIRTTFLLEAERFNIERIDALAEGPLEIVTSNMPEAWMLLGGGGRIDGDVVVDLARGSTVLIPASMPDSAAQLRRGTSLLRITLPSPLRGMIA